MCEQVLKSKPEIKKKKKNGLQKQNDKTATFFECVYKCDK